MVFAESADPAPPTVFLDKGRLVSVITSLSPAVSRPSAKIIPLKRGENVGDTFLTTSSRRNAE